MRCYLIDRYSRSSKSTYILYVVAHIRGGSLTQKSTYKDLAILTHTKSTYKGRSHKSTYRNFGPKRYMSPLT